MTPAGAMAVEPPPLPLPWSASRLLGLAARHTPPNSRNRACHHSSAGGVGCLPLAVACVARETRPELPRAQKRRPQAGSGGIYTAHETKNNRCLNETFYGGSCGFKHLKKCNSSRVSYFIRPITQELPRIPALGLSLSVPVVVKSRL